MLGGVRVPHSHGVLAHSDGDVLLHALCDALLGAAGLGDIGMHFPDSDPRWRGADSRAFLRHVRLLLQDRGYRVVNVDATVIAERPRLGRHREAMRANIGSDLGAGSGARQRQGDDDGRTRLRRPRRRAGVQAIVLIEQTTGKQAP